jgi:hypothetical protein
MSERIVMRIIVEVYEGGICKVICDGGDIDCEIASYAIKQALKLADYIATVLLVTMLSGRAENKDKNTGIM